MRLLEHYDDIRQWTAARSGNPAMEDRATGPGRPVLRLVFDQYLLNAGEGQFNDRPGGLDLVSWEEWFAELDAQKLSLRVEDEKPGILDSYYEFVPREGARR